MIEHEPSNTNSYVQAANNQKLGFLAVFALIFSSAPLVMFLQTSNYVRKPSIADYIFVLLVAATAGSFYANYDFMPSIKKGHRIIGYLGIGGLLISLFVALCPFAPLLALKNITNMSLSTLNPSYWPIRVGSLFAMFSLIFILMKTHAFPRN